MKTILKTLNVLIAVTLSIPFIPLMALWALIATFIVYAYETAEVEMEEIDNTLTVAGVFCAAPLVLSVLISHKIDEMYL
jgi:hypothetical protein